LENKIVINKPCLYFDFQKLTQDKLRINLFKNKIGEIDNKHGVRISSINSKYYYSQYIKLNEIILSVNNKPIDYNGYVKFEFYPEKIPIDDIGLWFVEGDTLTFKIFNPDTLTFNDISFTLKMPNTNLLSYYYLDSEPNYFVENNGLILSVLTEQHLDNLKSLELGISKLVKILERRLYHRDLFTVYLADINYTKIKNSKDSINWPIGEIIVEINDMKFNTFDEFIKITKNQITKIKTNENEVFFV
jgi:hypothetical protein